MATQQGAKRFLSVACIQVISVESVDKNLDTVKRLVEMASREGAELIVLPENFATFSMAGQFALGMDEVKSTGRIRTFMANLARENQVYLSGGTIPLADESLGKCFAASFFYSPQGEELCRYNKIHLFDASVNDTVSVYRESDTFIPGDSVVSCGLPFANIGFAVCYDLRFPELFQQLRCLGVDLIILPSAFTYATGEKHWETLVRARAIEQQCFIIACNQGGEHSEKRKTWGHSMIVDPDGQLLAQTGLGESVIMAKLDLAQLDMVRNAMPLMSHKRL